MPEAEDSELLDRFVRGDQDAFERLFRNHQRDVYRWILRVVRETGAAEDVLVETFWRAYRGRARFDASRSFGAWKPPPPRRPTVHLDTVEMRRLVSWPLVLLLATLVHVDWHFARPAHHRFSLGWSTHWLFAVAFFAAAGWYIARRWPVTRWKAAAWNVGAGASHRAGG